ncbi:MAG: tetratricopeptide repeat protein [Terriglobales bacterium]
MKYRVLFLSTLIVFAITFSAAQESLSSSGSGIGADRSLTALSESVSGSVVTADGHPLRNVRVELRSRGGATSIVASGYTLPNGTFEFDRVPRGLYEVVATVGVQEVRERISVDQMETTVTLRLGAGASAPGDPAAATVSVRQMKVPDKARKAFEKADEAFRKQKIADARAHLDKALEIFPHYAAAHTLRGILSLTDNHIEDARKELEEAVQDDGSYAMASIALGATYNLLSRFDDALRVLERGVALSPSSWQAYFEMSKSLLAKGQFTAALRQVNRAAELAPQTYAAIHVVRAHALLGLKDYTAAVSELEQYLGSNPQGPDSAQARQTLDQVRAFMAANHQAQ